MSPVNEDAESGDERTQRDSDAESGPESPSSQHSPNSPAGSQSPTSCAGSQSPTSPGPQSPNSPGPQSPNSPGPQSPASPGPQSPTSNCSQSPKSPGSQGAKSPSSPQSAASPQSPASPQSLTSERGSEHLPESQGASPSSRPCTPYSPIEEHEKTSPPQSPASDIQSPASVRSEHLSDDEGQNSVEMESDAEEENQGSGDDRPAMDTSGERDEESGAENERQSDAEDSAEEENIPEINIESADENEAHSVKGDQSDNEIDHSGDENDQRDREKNTAVESDEDIQRTTSSPKSPHESPVAEKNFEDEESEKKQDSDAEDNADSDSDADSDESEVGGLIADIFGESDDEEEFEGFKEEEIGSEKPMKEPVVTGKKKRAQIMSDSEDENEGDKDDAEQKEESEETQCVIEDVPAPPAEGEEEEEIEAEPAKKKKKVDSDSEDEDRKMREDFVSDFDMMMQKKKEESSKRRRRRDVDLISDSDDLIADIICQMRIAADEDKELNKKKKTATKKLKILPMVLSQLKKQDLKMAFLDQGVLNVIAEWLTPLPDRSLPHFNIREGMLKQLKDFPNIDQSLLKASGIGRALMYLFKHPRETKENRDRAYRLITEWARPIFNVATNYHALTKEEREQRDYDHIPKKRRKDLDGEEDEEIVEEPKKDIEKEMDGESKTLRPGDKGWVGRARVPMPSTKDYVNRPKWNVEMEFGRGPSKKPLNRIERHMRQLQDKKRLQKAQRAITISIEGRKMAI